MRTVIDTVAPAAIRVTEAHTLTGKPVIAIDWLDDTNTPRLAMYPPEKWRAANRLIRRITRREASE
jgi:hypothetical protein